MSAESIPTPEDIGQLRQLARNGYYLDAHSRMSTFLPPEQWATPAARHAGARLLQSLGALVRARRLHSVLLAEEVCSEEHAYDLGMLLLEQKGLHAALMHVERHFGPSSSPPSIKGTISAWSALLRARLLSYHRDFEAARHWMEPALEAVPDDAWAHVESSCILSAMDLHEEGLAAARKAHSLDPDYRTANTNLAHWLVQANRDDEAESLLKNAVLRMQHDTPANQLASLLMEQGRHAEAVEMLRKARSFAPLADDAWLRWHDARMADALYQAGDHALAREHATRVRHIAFFDNMTNRLSERGDGPPSGRLLVPLSFVRQKHMTCAPATIGAIANHWGIHVDHDELAAQVTYDGTPDHVGRHWLETHGWHVREFRADWESAVALLRRGIPFAIVSTAFNSSHLQAVMGCDLDLRVFILRDPMQRCSSDVLADRFLEANKAYGPRAMVLLPAEKAAMIEDLALPESGLFDAYYRLQRALEANDRASALREVERLQAEHPQERLTLWARRTLHGYDGDAQNGLSVAEELLQRYPDEHAFLREVSLLRSRVEERPVNTVARPRLRMPDAFWRDYIDRLRREEDKSGLALLLSRWLVRRNPTDAHNLMSLGNQLWERQHHDDACRIYRLAATCGDKDEQGWACYASAMQLRGSIEKVETLLRARAANLLRNSSAPAITLATFLENAQRSPEATRVIEEALNRRPDDGELLLYAARHFATHGTHERAQELVQKARACCPPQRWLRLAAQVAGWRVDNARALTLWMELHSEAPDDPGACEEIPRLLSALRGPDAGIDWLREQVAIKPHSLQRRRNLACALRNAPPLQAMDAIDEALVIAPQDAWLLRERALVLGRLGKLEEAHASAVRAEAAAPRAAHGPGVVGKTLLRLGRHAEAREASLRALRLGCSDDWLVEQCFEACRTDEERRATLDAMRELVVTHQADCDVILGLQSTIAGRLPAAEMGKLFDDLRSLLPHQWQTWTACMRHQLEQGDKSKALELGMAALSKFPLLPRLHLELADVYRHLDRPEDELKALSDTCSLSPGWPFAGARHAAVLERLGHNEEALRVLQRASSADPTNVAVLIQRARLLWGMGKCDEALATLERGLRLEPLWNEWSLLDEWAARLGKPDCELELLSELGESHAGSPGVVSRHARALLRRNRLAEALEEIEKGLKLCPLVVELHDLKAITLANLGRVLEANEACKPEILGEQPVELAARAAWIDARFVGLDSAIPKIKAVLERHPDHLYSWDLLATWHSEKGDWTPAIEAFSRLRALMPNSPYPLAELARLHAAKDEKPAAAEMLRLVLRLAPEDVDSAVRLMHLYCDLKQREQARAELARIQRMVSEHVGIFHEFSLAHRFLDETTMLALLPRLCQAPEREEWIFDAIQGDILGTRWVAQACAVLERELANPEVNPGAGKLWMELRLAHDRPWLLWLPSSRLSETVLSRIWCSYLDHIGATNSLLRLQWVFMVRGNWLKANADTWGKASFAFAACGCQARLISWMRGWQQREGLQPWMLYNLTQALQGVGRTQEAREVIEHSLSLAPDHTRTAFVGWACLELAYSGDYDQMLPLLETHDPGSPVKGGLFNIRQAQLLWKFSRLSEGQRRDRAGEFRKALAAAREEFKGEMSLAFLKRGHLQCRQHLEEMGGFKGRARWFRFRERLLAPVCTLRSLSLVTPGVIMAPLALLVMALIAVFLFSDNAPVVSEQASSRSSFGTGLFIPLALLAMFMHSRKES